MNIDNVDLADTHSILSTNLPLGLRGTLMICLLFF